MLLQLSKDRLLLLLLLLLACLLHAVRRA